MSDIPKHKLSEAVSGPISSGTPGAPDESGKPKPGHNEVAEQTRLQQEARPDGTPDQDERLTKIGRAQQTHG